MAVTYGSNAPRISASDGMVMMRPGFTMGVGGSVMLLLLGARNGREAAAAVDPRHATIGVRL